MLVFDQFAGAWLTRISHHSMPWLSAPCASVMKNEQLCFGLEQNPALRLRGTWDTQQAGQRGCDIIHADTFDVDTARYPRPKPDLRDVRVRSMQRSVGGAGVRPIHEIGFQHVDDVAIPRGVIAAADHCENRLSLRFTCEDLGAGKHPGDRGLLEQLGLDHDGGTIPGG